MFQRLRTWMDRLESPQGMLTTSEQVQSDRVRRTQAQWLDAVARLAVAQRHADRLTTTVTSLEAQARQAVLTQRDDLAIIAITRAQALRPQRDQAHQTATILTNQATDLRQQWQDQLECLQQFRRVRPTLQAAWNADRRITHH